MPSRNALLADMAREASLERSDFLVRAGEQLQRFMAAHANRIRALGGITLIDDADDFLAVAPDGTFRSRSRVYDSAKGDWVSDTEVIETAAELVELYNPADILQAFADADDDDLGARADGADAAAGADEGDGESASEAGRRTNGEDRGPYAGAADTWAAGQPESRTATNEAEAAAALYDLALEFQERSQRAESNLIESFENAASGLLGQVGTLVVVDDDDEHLALGVGGFRARVIPEGEAGWRDLSNASDIVQFYDPTDVFGDLAEAIAEAYPDVDDGGSAAAAEGDEDEGDVEEQGEVDDDEVDDELEDDEGDDAK